MNHIVVDLKYDPIDALFLADEKLSNLSAGLVSFRVDGTQMWELLERIDGYQKLLAPSFRTCWRPLPDPLEGVRQVG